MMRGTYECIIVLLQIQYYDTIDDITSIYTVTTNRGRAIEQILDDELVDGGRSGFLQEAKMLHPGNEIDIMPDDNTTITVSYNEVSVYKNQSLDYKYTLHTQQITR